VTFVLIHVPLRFYGLVMRVYPPRFKSDEHRRDAYDDSSLNRVDEEVHVVGGDLTIPLADANQRDDPELYYYWIYILEFEKEKGEKGKKEVAPQVIGSTMECHCRIMRYLRQSPSYFCGTHVGLAGIVCLFQSRFFAALFEIALIVMLPLPLHGL